MRPGVCSMVVAGVLFVGCGGGDEKEESAGGDPVTGDALETCLTEEGLDVERGESGPIDFGEAGTFTPEALLVHSPVGDRNSVPRQDILVLEQEDAESYDQALPPGVKDNQRFGANVLVFVSAVTQVGDDRPLIAPAEVRRALETCVS